MTKQVGWYFNADRCVQCRACETACKAANNVAPGLKWRRVIDIWEGRFPEISRDFLSLACLHCAHPPCLAACPTGAITKRAEDGVVIVDRDQCNGCRSCAEACPYDVPQFGPDGTMQKCDFCTHYGQGPACAAACPADALQAGAMEELASTVVAKGARQPGGAAGPSIYVLNRKGHQLVLKKLDR